MVSKSGSTYGVKGKLSELEYNGHKYVGFERTGFADSANGVPKAWCGHTFTDDEKTKLEAGEVVHVEGLVSKKTGGTFNADLSYDKNEKKIVPHF